MRAIWKGAISFGLVTIPISLYPAIRHEEVKFRLLRNSDLSPVHYKRVAEADGKEVEWDHIVKGFEYKKDKFVAVNDADLERADLEAAQTIGILNFVKLDEVNPLLFYKPYYLESGKGGDKAYVLLRDALAESGRIAIAKVVIKTRQHLAAIKPQDKSLMLELMHFPADLLDTSEFKIPTRISAGKAEMKMALQLIDSMTVDWDPADYKDEYRGAIEAMIEKKLAKGGHSTALPRRKKMASNVLDLATVLKRSIQQATGKPAKAKHEMMLRKGAA